MLGLYNCFTGAETVLYKCVKVLFTPMGVFRICLPISAASIGGFCQRDDNLYVSSSLLHNACASSTILVPLLP